MAQGAEQLAQKFHDKLAEQALEQALSNHAEAVQQRDALYTEKESLQTELQGIESELSELDKQQGTRLPAGTCLTVSAIDKALDDQMARKDGLTETLARGKLRLKFIQQACMESNVKVNQAKTNVGEARATLAAAFERHVFSTREVKTAFTMLRQTWAMWDTSITGPGYFDRSQWAAKLAQEPPADEHYQDARELMRITCNE